MSTLFTILNQLQHLFCFKNCPEKGTHQPCHPPLCLPGVAVTLENTPRQGERKARLRRTSLWKQFCGQSSRVAHLNPGHSRLGHAPPVLSFLPLLHAQSLLMSPGSFSKIEEIIQANAAVACTASKGSYMFRQEGAAINAALA